MSCGKPDDLDQNAICTNTTNTFMSVIRCNCPGPKFTRDRGHPIRICQSNGKWTKRPLICKQGNINISLFIHVVGAHHSYTNSCE